MSLHRIKDSLCRSLDEMPVSDNMTITELEKVHLMTDTIKNIGKIEMQGYSQSGGWSAHGYVRDYSKDYDRNNSYGRHYVRGHYSRDMGEKFEQMMNDPSISMADKETLRRAVAILN